MTRFSLDAERSRAERMLQDGADAHVALSVAAAVTFHQVHGNARSIVTRQDYDDALNLAAAALARMIPVYALRDARQGREKLAIDVSRQSFVRGATQLAGRYGEIVDRLTVLRADLRSALAQLKKIGMPLFVGAAPAGPRQNRLLAALPVDEYQRLAWHMERTPIDSKQLLYTENLALRHVYFPVSGVVSLLYVTHDGQPTEIAVIGNDGLIGLGVLLGGAMAPRRAVVQIAGEAYRIKADPVVEEFRRGGALQTIVLRYVQSLMNQMAQTAVCNRHHAVEQQLCRWLLLSLDRIGSNEILMTQDLISQMLGVRRAGITEAAKRLQELGLIQYRRGAITVPDRAKLEAHACECYSVVKRESERLLSQASGQHAGSSQGR